MQLHATRSQDILMLSLSFQFPGSDGLGTGFLILRTMALSFLSPRPSFRALASTKLMFAVPAGAGVAVALS